MQYILLTITLFSLLLIYFKIADRYNIIDKPNHRSAHTEITLRGGGIIFWFSSLLYFMQHFQENYLFFLGITIMSLVSFWDDVKSLPNRIRLLTHFIAITLAFYSLNIFHLLPIYFIIIAYVFFIGIINAYNFMDGINGITGLYTIVVMGSLLYVNQNIHNFINRDFIIYPIIASLVFLFFNFRKKAKCFAGDVGSISIAFWVVFLILKLSIETKSIIWILFLTVYGVDTVCTIIHRIYLKENVFEAHRHHYYQILSNDYKIQHRIVASLYAFIQIIVSIVVILLYRKINEILIYLIVLTPLLFVYLSKFYLIKKLSHKL
jgi:UDP-N-acetylmuramyl pentapeptide phosphotransferase/UDP-N-acetylglucosamine-1-phosphate transferase